MAKLTQSGNSNWESAQVAPDQSATEFFGGSAPTHVDVIKSANARGQKRHEMKQQGLADLEVLPDSAELLGNEMVGVRDSGYIAKKNLEYGVNAMYQSLPPGMDIEDQEYCDIRKMEVRDVINYDQVTKDATTRSLVTGFDRKKLLNTDDEYTREHNDPFYSDMVVEDEIGFVERNNMLDRL